MHKKAVALLLLLTLSFVVFTSCGLDYRYSLDENLHNKIEYVLEEEAPSYIKYQDQKYLYAGTTNLFRVDVYEASANYYLSYKDDVLLSWNGHRYIGYIDEYYADTTENPLFIYNERLHWVYFREDYDYWIDTFVIDNTVAEIVWKDIFAFPQASFDFEESIQVGIYSKQCPRLKTYLQLACVENQWYVSLPNSKDVWAVSEAFVKILSENGLI